MKLNIYVAGRFREYERVRAVVDEIIAIGHEITHDWTRSLEFDENGRPLVPIEESTKALTPSDSKKYALDDLQGVRDADIMILLADSEGLYGALIEAGIAIECAVEVWLVDPIRDSVFWYLSPCRRFGSIGEVYERLLDHLSDPD